MGDVFVKDPNLDVSCGSDAVVGQITTIGPARFSYTIVNDSDDEAFVSMVAALAVSIAPDPIFTEQDLQRFVAPHSSFVRDTFTIFGQRTFDQAGQVTTTATLTFNLFPSGQLIFNDQVVCQLNVADAGA
jgi:hypothetical protein